MKASELLRKLKALGATVDPSRGKGGHVRVSLNGRTTFVPTGTKDLKTGTVSGILKQLGLDGL